MGRCLKFAISISALIICCSVLSSCGPGSLDFYIFSDIGECDNIEVFKSDDAVVTVYDTPEMDKNIGDLEYNSFYGASYKSDNLGFEIFAYEFINSDSARKYFKNETGIDTGIDTHFLASGGIGEYSVIVIDECNAYYANTTQRDSENLKRFLGEVFSKKLTS